jgi:Tol biopolymer transport system component
MRRTTTLLAALIVGALAVLTAGLLAQSKADVALRAAMETETVKGDLKAAIEQYRVLASGADRAVAAKALVRLGECYQKQGAAQAAEARKTFEKVVREFADQKEAVAEAQHHLSAESGAADSGVVARQLQKVGDRDYGSAISRDGRYLAYQNQGRVIGVHDLATGAARMVVTSPGEGVWLNTPLISPDAKSIAYLMGATAAGLGTYLVNADGTGSHLLKPDTGETMRPWGWTPDGKSLLVGVVRQGKNDAALYSIADGSLKMIASGFRNGRLSPDGRYVALVRQTPQNVPGGIVVTSVAGGSEVSVFSGPYGQPLWSHDGTRLLAVAARDGANELWSVPLTDGVPTGPPAFVKNDVSSLLAASPGGEYYVQTRSMAREIYVASVDSQTTSVVSPPRQVTAGNNNGGAAWSPDGESLAYYSIRGRADDQTFKIVIRNSRTGEEREVPLKEEPNLPAFRPQWFPDSRSLFVHSFDGRLRRLDVKTGEFTPLLEQAKIAPYHDKTPYTLYFSYVLLAPDGRAIYYLVRDADANQTRILTRNLEGGPESEVCRLTVGGIPGVAISPDGHSLVYAVGGGNGTGPSGSVWTVPTSGGEPKEIYRDTTHWLYDPVWSADGHHVLVFADYANGDIAVIPADGGEAKTLRVVMTMKYFLAVHPDGRQIAFVDEVYNKHLWMLKNLFPAPKADK